MGFSQLCDYSKKSCGTCKYFQYGEGEKPTKAGSALSYSGFSDGICTCKTGVNYGEEYTSLYDGPYSCYQKLIIEDTPEEKIIKTVAKGILKTFFFK